MSFAAEQYGLYYAPDPSSQSVCTIGGNVAFNSGGAHCFKYGMTLNHVLGLRAVLPTGEVVTLGGRSLEHVGSDLTGAYVGSEGLFGVALEITLQTAAAAGEVSHRAGRVSFAGSGRRRGLRGRRLGTAAGRDGDHGQPVDPGRRSRQCTPGIRSTPRPSSSSNSKASTMEVDAQAVGLSKLIDASGAYEVRVARNADERAAIWKGRKSAFSAVGRLSPDFIVQDGVVPRTRLGEALVRIEEISRRHGLRVANVFHAGDGNLHPLILYDGRVPGEHERAEEIAGEILRMCIAFGGSITGEHGVGMEKRAFLGDMLGDDVMACMKRLRRIVDPHEIANRGKVFAEGEAPALMTHGLHPLEKAGVISRE